MPVTVSYAELCKVLHHVLVGAGMPPDRAARCAALFAGATLDGVSSHGVNRFPRFVAMIRAGVVDVHARMDRSGGSGALERWDGRRGPGNLNAWDSMERALALAREHGIGCVALANTNHWMRGGSYGWQAAEAGAVALCWTNTMPNLPPWGASDPRVGNNPLVVAVPRPPAHIVLDMALSQFSYGALENHRTRGERLPVVGGFDIDGRLTDDPGAIEASGRPLPIGFWKGSGLALMLDMVAAILSGGRATYQVPPQPEEETGLSQLFIAIDPARVGEPAIVTRIADRIVEHFQMSFREKSTGPGHPRSPVPDEPKSTGAREPAARIRYPGQRTLEIRRRNLEDGIPIDAAVWDRITKL